MLALAFRGGGRGALACCWAGPVKRPPSTRCLRPFATGPAGCSSCVARPESGRPRCSTGQPGRRATRGWPGWSASSRRWTWASRDCTRSWSRSSVSLSGCPDRSSAALGAAFGMVSGSAPDRFLVGLAALTLITEAAAKQPVLCVVDDAQWLDRVSLEVLGFVARRLQADPVGMIFAVRDGERRAGPLDGLAQLAVGPLADDAAMELLAAAARCPVVQQVGSRIVAQAAGNALAPRGVRWRAHRRGGLRRRAAGRAAALRRAPRRAVPVAGARAAARGAAAAARRGGRPDRPARPGLGSGGQAGDRP